MSPREFKPGDRVRLVLRDERDCPAEALSVDGDGFTIALDHDIPADFEVET